MLMDKMVQPLQLPGVGVFYFKKSMISNISKGLNFNSNLNLMKVVVLIKKKDSIHQYFPTSMPLWTVFYFSECQSLNITFLIKKGHLILY